MTIETNYQGSIEVGDKIVRKNGVWTMEGQGQQSEEGEYTFKGNAEADGVGTFVMYKPRTNLGSWSRLVVDFRGVIKV